MNGVLGGALGTGGAILIFNVGRVDALYKFFPTFEITEGTAAVALLTSLGVGLVSGLVPAIALRKMKVLEALQRIG